VSCAGQCPAGVVVDTHRDGQVFGRRAASYSQERAVGEWEQALWTGQEEGATSCLGWAGVLRGWAGAASYVHEGTMLYRK
jgi:hypothetical protein